MSKDNENQDKSGKEELPKDGQDSVNSSREEYLGNMRSSSGSSDARKGARTKMKHLLKKYSMKNKKRRS